MFQFTISYTAESVICCGKNAENILKRCRAYIYALQPVHPLGLELELDEIVELLISDISENNARDSQEEDIVTPALLEEWYAKIIEGDNNLPQIEDPVSHLFRPYPN